MRPSRLSQRPALGALAQRSGSAEEDDGTGLGGRGATEDELGGTSTLVGTATSEEDDSISSEEDVSIIGSDEEENEGLGISLTSEHAQKNVAKMATENAEIKR